MIHWKQGGFLFVCLLGINGKVLLVRLATDPLYAKTETTGGCGASENMQEETVKGPTAGMTE